MTEVDAPTAEESSGLSAPSTVVPNLGPGSDFIPDEDARREEMRAYRGMVGVIGRRVAQPAVSAAAPAVLVPGFVSGEISMTILSRHLRRLGHRTFGSGVGANLGCTDDMVARVERRVESVVAEQGRPVALVGHSRGGMIVKLLAMRRPELISGIVVLSAPVTGNLAVATHVRQELEGLFRLNRRGIRRVMSEDCVTGECAARVAARLAEPFPESVAYTSVYSPRDAIIDWHTCLDPAASLIELPVAHTGMATDPRVLAVVAERLRELRS